MPLKGKLLIVDDDHTLKSSLIDWFENEHHQVFSAASGEEALELIAEKSIDIIITDLKMPGINGLDVLREAKNMGSHLEVIIMTAYGTIDSAVLAMKQGAYDYIVKPFPPDEIDLIVNKILNHQSLVRENILLRQQLQAREKYENIIGKSPKMQTIYAFIEKVAPTNISVLIQGESGTGKELIARAIHKASPRKNNPFIPVSCGALPDALLESELFGHERGAFTGAVEKQEGRFEMADTGTIFLDEIAEMSTKSQVDLLRVLQEKEFRRIGGKEAMKVDVRTIAATNKDLDVEVDEGRFREDLYYRLHVAPITLPPLRDRYEDIPLLTKHFLNKYNTEYNKNINEITASAMNLLLQYSWPGNVREMEHVIGHSILMTSGDKLEPENLPEKILKKTNNRNGRKSTNYDGFSLNEKVQQFEKQTIIEALKSADGKKKDAAKNLGITARNLSYFIKKYGL